MLETETCLNEWQNHSFTILNLWFLVLAVSPPKHQTIF